MAYGIETFNVNGKREISTVEYLYGSLIHTEIISAGSTGKTIEFPNIIDWILPLTCPYITSGDHDYDYKNQVRNHYAILDTTNQNSNGDYYPIIEMNRNNPITKDTYGTKDADSYVDRPTLLKVYYIPGWKIDKYDRFYD